MTDPQILISLAIDDERWRDIDVETDFENFIESTVRTAFLSANTAWLPKANIIDISIVLTSDDNVQSLNAEYRGKDSPTNVLSFPQFSSEECTSKPLESLDFLPLGDIIMARETILREAGEQNKEINAHFAHLIVHGTLHLLGYDHEIDSEAIEMETLEVAILNGLGFDNPYDDTDTDTSSANGDDIAHG